MRHICLFVLFIWASCNLCAQMQYGTTGLLHAPTAEMQKDKTFMMGGTMMHRSTFRDSYWNAHDEYNPYTYNYYINITFFPWLEVGYTCTLVKGIHNSNYWPPQTWGKFVNQDRSFHGRLRLWKEGWWKEWTPQIVLGANDPGSHEQTGGGNIVFDNVGDNTNHLTRFYLAASKHFTFRNWGTLGAHASILQFDGPSWENERGVALGANFRFNRPGDDFWTKALNGLNLMGEYYDGTMNLGGCYSVWKERINVTGMLYDGRYLSLGMYFRVHLR